MVFTDYIKAGYPLIWCRTYEPERLIGEMANSELGKIRSLSIWDCNRGYRTFSNGEWSTFVPLDEADPYSMPEIMAKSNKTIWLLLNYHWFMNEPKVMQGLLNSLGVYKARGVTAMIVSPEARINAQVGIPKEIDRDLVILDYNLPDKQAINTLLSDMEKENQVMINEETLRSKVLDSVQGLTWGEAENAMALSLVRTKGFSPKVIGALKGQMVEKNGALEFSQYSETFASIGGLETLKEWTLNRFNKRRPGLPFRGIILLGIPGTGKSLFAKALGNEVGWNVLSLSFSRVFGSLVGESESQMREALKVVDAMAPAILFLDEFEKGLAGVGGSSNDGGTTQRVGGIFLTWMQDRISDVFVVATANDIARLPTEYKRTGGRWDSIFFVDLPTIQERLAILEVYLKQFPISEEMAQKARQILPAKLDGYTGAEIRQVVIEMGYGQEPEAAANFVIPLSKSQDVEIKALRESAKSWQKASKPEVTGWSTKATPRRVTI